MRAFAQRIVPAAFDIFQYWIGGTAAKRRLIMRHYTNQKHVLEVGCGTGNIASAFLNHDVDYTGLDVDGPAIDYASRKFRHKRGFSFVCGELQKHSFRNVFDFIVFAGVLHHVADATATAMLEFSRRILSEDGVVLVSDPIKPSPGDSPLIKLDGKLDRGQFLRTSEDLSALLMRLRGLRVVRQECPGVAPFPVCSGLTVANFGVFLLKKCAV